jgi:trehalose synthase-fused probable maltokinase
MASRTPRSDALKAWLPRQRWFASKVRRIAQIVVEDWVPIATGGLAIVAVILDDGAVERYAVPLLSGDDVIDALADPPFCRALLDLVAASGAAQGDGGEVRGTRTRAFPAELPAALPARPLGAEQSNTSVTFGDALILKHFRLLQPGVNPDREISWFLTERTSFRATPRLAGDLQYRSRAGESATLALVQELIPNATDGWRWMLQALRGAAEGEPSQKNPKMTDREQRNPQGATLAAFRELGTQTAALHLALASDTSDPAFAPEPITPADLTDWADGVRRQVESACGVLGADHAVPRAPDVAAGLAGLAGRHKIRHHGDFHLGQTLRRPDGGFMIIDFEGEPARPLEERRRKHAALRDVAGMLRSIDYAAASALRAVRGAAEVEPSRRIPRSAKGGLDDWATAWAREAGAAFVGAYRETAGAASFLPTSSEAFDRAVAVFVLEKAAYEVVYEANNRPDWIEIPARGLATAAAALAARSPANVSQ